MGRPFRWRSRLLAGAAAVSVGGHAVAQPPDPGPDASGSVSADGVRHGRVGPMADDARRPAVAWTWTRSGELRRVDRDGVVWDHGPDGARRVGELGMPILVARFGGRGRRLFAATPDCRGFDGRLPHPRAVADGQGLELRDLTVRCREPDADPVFPDTRVDGWYASYWLPKPRRFGSWAWWRPGPLVRLPKEPRPAAAEAQAAATDAAGTRLTPVDQLTSARLHVPCRAMSRSPSGRYLACGDDDTVWTVDRRDDALRALLPYTERGALPAMRDGMRRMASDGDPGFDSRGARVALPGEWPWIVDLATGERLVRLASPHRCTELAWSGDDQHVAAICGNDTDLRVWRRDGASVAVVHDGELDTRAELRWLPSAGAWWVPCRSDAQLTKRWAGAPLDPRTCAGGGAAALLVDPVGAVIAVPHPQLADVPASHELDYELLPDDRVAVRAFDRREAFQPNRSFEARLVDGRLVDVTPLDAPPARPAATGTPRVRAWGDVWDIAVGPGQVRRVVVGPSEQPTWWLAGAGVHVAEVEDRVLFVDVAEGRLLRTLHGWLRGVTEREVVVQYARWPSAPSYLVDARGGTVLVADGRMAVDARGAVAIVGGRIVERAPDGTLTDLGAAPEGPDGPADQVVGLIAGRWAAVMVDDEGVRNASNLLMVDRRGELPPVPVRTDRSVGSGSLPDASVLQSEHTVHLFGAAGYLEVPLAEDQRHLKAWYDGVDLRLGVRGRFYRPPPDEALRVPVPAGLGLTPTSAPRPRSTVEDGRVRDADGRLHHQLFVFADGDWVVLRGDGTWSGRDRYGRVAVQTTSGVVTTLVDGRPWGTASGR